MKQNISKILVAATFVVAVSVQAEVRSKAIVVGLCETNSHWELLSLRACAE